MNQKDKSIKLAELEGWQLRWQNRGGGELFTEKPEGHCWQVWLFPQNYWNIEVGEAPWRAIDYRLSPPDYFKDLNAVHELEKVIKKDFYLWKAYESFLARIVLGDCGMFHITAAQRCEAIGKTLNLW
jgi:hypothetical protein